MKSDVYSSQLSLGEIVHDTGMHPSRLPDPRLSVDFDGISPISAQEICKNDLKLMRETKKLIRAVKQEDAYGIVCALKRGANPCLLINDVSTLHLAAGLKSDQRCSIVSIDGFHRPR
jgi:glutaredoxin-related protein